MLRLDRKPWWTWRASPNREHYIRSHRKLLIRPKLPRPTTVNMENWREDQLLVRQWKPNSPRLFSPIRVLIHQSRRSLMTARSISTKLSSLWLNTSILNRNDMFSKSILLRGRELTGEELSHLIIRSEAKSCATSRRCLLKATSSKSTWPRRMRGS